MIRFNWFADSECEFNSLFLVSCVYENALYNTSQTLSAQEFK